MRVDSRLALSQWETSLQSNAVSHWLGAHLESALSCYFLLWFCPIISDKFKRTALIHAVRDGAANIASYLLSRGADPNVADSSGNTALHYAAAYGWYFCLKALLDAGAAADAPNDWKVRSTESDASYQWLSVRLYFRQNPWWWLEDTMARNPN